MTTESTKKVKAPVPREQIYYFYDLVAKRYRDATLDSTELKSELDKLIEFAEYANAKANQAPTREELKSKS